MIPDPALRNLMKPALQREAASNLAAGHRLLDGQWVPADTLHSTRRRRRTAHLRHTIEALLLWAITALAGLAFMALVVAIL